MADESNLDVAEIVVRLSTRYQQMAADKRRAADSRFADFMDEDIDNYIEVKDDEDRTYQHAETEGYVKLKEDTDDDDDED